MKAENASKAYNANCFLEWLECQVFQRRQISCCIVSCLDEGSQWHSQASEINL